MRNEAPSAISAEVVSLSSGPTPRFQPPADLLRAGRPPPSAAVIFGAQLTPTAAKADSRQSGGSSFFFAVRAPTMRDEGQSAKMAACPSRILSCRNPRPYSPQYRHRR
jgi:hypothetical protein